MRGTPFAFEGFTGGLNTQADPYQLDQTEAREAMNVVSTQRGSIRKRYGSSLFGEAPNVELTSAFSFVNVERSLVCAGGTGFYEINAAGTLIPLAGAAITEGYRWSMVEAPVSKEVGFEGPIYMTNGGDPPRQFPGFGLEVKAWTGAASVKVGETTVECYENATTKEHIPNGKFMIFAGNRIWMTGIADDPSAVWFSELVSIGEGGEQADPSYWPKTNVVRFDSSDKEPITGIGTVGPYILVFKERKTWVIHNLANGENRKLSNSIGCIAQRSIVETAHGTFFLTSDQGIYLTNGSTLTEVSYNVRPTILAINPAYRQNAAGAYFNNHYYLSYPSGTSVKNNLTLDYDLQLKSWWLHDLAANDWSIYEPTTGATGLYALPPKVKAGVVKAFDETVYTDSGENYTGNGTLGAYWKSSWDPFAYYVFRHRIKAPMLKKRVRSVFFNGEGSIIPSVYKDFQDGERQEPAVVANREISTQSELPVDFSASAETWGESPEKWGEETGVETLWGGEVSIGQARIYAPGVAFVWSVGWGNNSNKAFTVDAYVMSLSFRKS